MTKKRTFRFIVSTILNSTELELFDKKEEVFVLEIVHLKSPSNYVHRIVLSNCGINLCVCVF